jgi:hypothetical protein
MASTVTESRCPVQKLAFKYSKRAKETGVVGVTCTLVCDVLAQLHDDSGHMGIEKTMARLERFWWPGMTQDVKD